MAVHEFRRIADVLRRDGIHALFEDLVIRASRDHHAESERGQQREPEGVILIHVEHTWDADVSACGLGRGQTAIGEGTLVFEVIQVGAIGTLLASVPTTLATVAGYVA